MPSSSLTSLLNLPRNRPGLDLRLYPLADLRDLMVGDEAAGGEGQEDEEERGEAVLCGFGHGFH